MSKNDILLPKPSAFISFTIEPRVVFINSIKLVSLSCNKLLVDSKLKYCKSFWVLIFLDVDSGHSYLNNL